MNRKGFALLPVLIILVIIFLTLSAGAFYLYYNEHAQNIRFKEQIVDLENQQRITEGRLAEAKKMASELQLKLQETKVKLDSLTEEFAQEKSAHIETLNQLEQYKTDLQQQRSLRQDLENRLKITEDSGRAIKEQLKIIQQQKDELEEKIKNAEVGSGNVELGKVIVNNEPAASVKNPVKGKSKPVKPEKINEKAVSPQSKSLAGKVMVVNEEFNFVVINLGSKDNVMPGDVFLVSRGNKTIGEVKIEKVHEAMSAAGFAPELKNLIKENDKIIQKAK